jgi:hypothetical protein
MTQIAPSQAHPAGQIRRSGQASDNRALDRGLKNIRESWSSLITIGVAAGNKNLLRSLKINSR